MEENEKWAHRVIVLKNHRDCNHRGFWLTHINYPICERNKRIMESLISEKWVFPVLFNEVIDFYLQHFLTMCIISKVFFVFATVNLCSLISALSESLLIPWRRVLLPVETVRYLYGTLIFRVKQNKQNQEMKERLSTHWSTEECLLPTHIYIPPQPEL